MYLRNRAKFRMESLTREEAVGVNSEIVEGKPQEILYLLPYGFLVRFSQDTKFA